MLPDDQPKSDLLATFSSMFQTLYQWTWEKVVADDPWDQETSGWDGMDAGMNPVEEDLFNRLN